MSDKSLENYTLQDIFGLLQENVAIVILADTSVNKYRVLARNNDFADFVEETGSYDDLIQKLWFHISESNEKVSDEYNAFVSYYGKFKGKYSRKIKLYSNGSQTPTILQMTVYPIKDTTKYVYIMDELYDEYVQEYMTSGKVNTTIQNTFLFSMYVDLVNDTTSSISVTEVSEEVINADIKYSDWRMMTVNMIWPEDKEQFLKITDPEYLKNNLARGRTTSFDCQMQNLEGKFIWVKLIFSRAMTSAEEDFRFVFMVQNIHDSSMQLMSELKKYEKLAQNDTLTELLNQGSIKNEINISIDKHHRGGINVAMMMLDLDFFKKVNDTYGHSAGDTVLKSLADLLKDFVAEKEAAVGRWGGEEFVIVYNNKTGDELYAIADELRKKVEATEFPKIGHVTCSIGVTQVKDDDTFEDAFDRMDKAMYLSKENGRNTVTLV
ncbi:GGDEF domain-containing protein [Butyrivibrio sp. INlla21]|uniref:GGDEF domain-containing protein n=1 Tax=Butyrivibrio sp. INlla21 TaxID=1520811 RepID=UPI0008F1B785|nr:GGDEF domain-containing protein [Butyrivibrio sp. INlla21]SFU92419.1 diguanylate cyclase (GGDEF) domain-containing protein [Butyrivibrio sp. INlla21]